MNNQTENYKNQIEKMAQGEVSLDPKKTALLVVDMVNDGHSDEGFFKKVLGADISMFQGIEDNVVQLMRACKTAGIPRICVQSVYDFAYISDAMKQQFLAMGMQEGQLALKGSWGAQVIEKLLAEKPEYILTKSHYSAFAYLKTMMYEDASPYEFTKNLKNYLSYGVVSDDERNHDLAEYYRGAARNKNGETTTLQALMEAQGITTLIIVGGSTHVCEDAAVSGASERGYRVIEPIDAVASEDVDKHYAYLHNHGIFKSQLTTTAKLIEAISK